MENLAQSFGNTLAHQPFERSNRRRLPKQGLLARGRALQQIRSPRTAVGFLGILCGRAADYSPPRTGGVDARSEARRRRGGQIDEIWAWHRSKCSRASCSKLSIRPVRKVPVTLVCPTAATVP